MLKLPQFHNSYFCVFFFFFLDMIQDIFFIITTISALYQMKLVMTFYTCVSRDSTIFLTH